MLITIGGRLSEGVDFVDPAGNEQSTDVSRCSHLLRGVLQAGIISTGTIAGPGLRGFARVNVALTVAWLAPHDASLSNIERGLYDSNGTSIEQLVEALTARRGPPSRVRPSQRTSYRRPTPIGGHAITWRLG